MATLLIIEDNPGSSKPLASLLRAQGYETLCAENGDAALHLLRSTRPGLILLDLMMPVMSGLEFLKVLRGDPQLANLPVIVVTAKPPGDESVREAKLLGARECLTKADFTPDQLFTSIRRHVAA